MTTIVCVCSGQRSLPRQGIYWSSDSRQLVCLSITTTLSFLLVMLAAPPALSCMLLVLWRLFLGQSPLEIIFRAALYSSGYFVRCFSLPLCLLDLRGSLLLRIVFIDVIVSDLGVYQNDSILSCPLVVSAFIIACGIFLRRLLLLSLSLITSAVNTSAFSDKIVRVC